MEEFGKLEERVVLVGVQTDDHDNVEESLDELKELASTAGAVTVGRIIQNRRVADSLIIVWRANVLAKDSSFGRAATAPMNARHI